jgi:hypothetical protein
MRKIRAIEIKELERRILILSLLYIIVFVNFLFLFKWSNGWLESLGGRVFSKKNMEFQVA